MNDKNLTKFGIDKEPLSHEEAKKNGQKGGKASVEARRRKKSMQAAMKFALDQDATEAQKRNIESVGLDSDGATNREALAARIYAQAMSGSVSSQRLLIEIVGEGARDAREDQYLKIEKERLKLEGKKQDLDRLRFEKDVGEDDAKESAISAWIESVIESEQDDE